MKIIKETDQRFVGLEKKIGMFVVLAIVGIIAVVAFIGFQQEIFISKTSLYFIADSGQGINEGMAVKLSGFRIGKVKELSLDDIARVKVELSINSKYMRWIKSDSKARLLKEGLIGESIIEITPGSKDAKEVKENEVIVFEREKGISEMVEELKDEIKPALTDIREIIHYLNDPQGDVKQSFKNVRRLSEDIHITKQHIDTLLKNTDKNLNSTIKKIDSVLDSTEQTITGAGNVIERIDKNIPPIMEKVHSSLENVQKTTEEIKKAVEKSTPHIPSLVEKGSEVTEGTKEIVDSVKQTWPIRLFIKKPEGKTLKVDSYDSK